MASLIKMQEKNDIVEEVYQRINNAEENRLLEFTAIVRIQAWFRGQRVRSYLKFLNKSATEIQRRFRGYTGRQRYRQILKENVFHMKLNHYNAMATKIQKVWKGFYTRKYISNYYSRKRYMEGLKIKNEIIRQELEDYAEQQAMVEQMKEEKKQMEKLDEYARKHHHLVSTEVIPGVYNSPFQQHQDLMEVHLRNAKPALVQKQKEKQKQPVFDPAWKRYDLPKLDPLPPISTKPQGPFRDPKSVQQQRYKAFQPTLRVATDYYSLEKARELMKQQEWVTMINDNVWQPVTGRTFPPHESLLHSTSGYGHLPYGTKCFREELPHKFVTVQNFQTVVPPIPILEKLNDTYSQGQV